MFTCPGLCTYLDCVWNVMAHTQKPDSVFRRNGRVYLNGRGPQFNQLMAAEVCASAVVMLDTPCSEVVWRVLATHSIRQFPLHFPTRASPSAITFQLDQHNAVSHKRLPSLQPFCHLLQTFRNTSVTPHCVTCSWLVIKYVSPSFPLS